MGVDRQCFRFDTNSSVQTLTGNSFFGAILQVGWSPETTDTGDNLEVILCPVAGDTGGGFPVFAKEGLGSPFLNALGVKVLHKNASDTGAAGAQSTYVASGDHLVARVTPSGAALKGTLNIWTYTG